VVYQRRYQGGVSERLRRKSRTFDLFSRALSAVSRTLSGGRLDATHSDMIVVAQRT
jgi:hypothetical protein